MPVLFKQEAFDNVAGQFYCIGLIVVLNEAVSSVFHFHYNCCGTVLFHHISIQEDYDGIYQEISLMSNFNFQSGQKPCTRII